MRSIIWMAGGAARARCEQLAAGPLIVGSVQEFIDAPRDSSTISFLDSSTLATLTELEAQLGADDVPRPEWRKLVASVSLGPVILISRDSAQAATAGLESRPWLSHVLSASMLEHRTARTHLGHVLKAAGARAAPNLMDWMGQQVSGRAVLLANASKRFARIDKLGAFVTSKGGSQRTAKQLREVAEELLSNAFYNAPVAAGAVDHPIPRTQDVSLPEDGAIDLAYGCHDDLAFVRVRDAFGSLSRKRLAEVLARTASSSPAPDTSMGGSGFGLSRVFSAASLVAISVLSNHHTEIVVGILDGGLTGGTSPAEGAPRPFAFHLFFRDSARRRMWKAADQDTAVGDTSLTNTFLSIVIATDGE